MIYDVTCPVCGTVNRVYLDETDGWMVCEYCGVRVRDADYAEAVDLPAIRTLEVEGAFMKEAG